MTSSRPVLTLKKPHRAARKPVKQTAPAKAVRLKSAGRSKSSVEVKSRGRSGAAARKPRPPQRPQSTGTDMDLLAALQKVAPEIWNPKAPAPLAVGIHKQLYPIAEGVDMSRKSVRKFLSRWTSTADYRRALSEPGASRFNHDGSPAGEVSEEHREMARQRVSPEPVPVD